MLASWNGLALAALAEGARRFERADWLDAARGVAEFLLGPLSRDDGRLSRSWREGKVSGEGFLDDYANVAHGLLELHLATGESRFLTEAHRSRCSPSTCSTIPSTAASSSPRRAARSSWRARRGSTTTRFRPATRCSRTCCSGSAGSGVTTSSSASACRCCGSWRRRSPRAPGAFGWTLCALDLWLSPPREIAIVGPADSAVARAALAPFAPNTVAAFGPADGVPLLEGKTLVDGKPAVYVCERFACQAPVTDPADLRSD